MPGEAKVIELRQQLQDCQVQAGRMLKQAKEEADKTHLEEMTRLELRHDQVCSLFILQSVVFMIFTMPFICLHREFRNWKRRPRKEFQSWKKRLAKFGSGTRSSC